jgi:hypothetical protein
MGAPLGNQNGRKAKEWTDALRWQLENYEGSGIQRGQALRSIAKKVIEDALSGSPVAWQEVGNRLDGKPTNETELTATFEGKVSGVAPCYGLQPPPDRPTS